MIIGIGHAGRYSPDPAALARFYQDVLGMQVVSRSAPDAPGGSAVFLSTRPAEEHHELSLFDRPEFQHIAFKVATLADLRAFYRRLQERGVPIRFCANHLASLACYFEDPDGNLVEVYWLTGRPCSTAVMEPVDLAETGEILLQAVARAAEDVARSGRNRDDAHRD